MAERSFTVRLSARVDAYVNAIKQAERETYNFSRTSQRNMGRLGTQMQSLGRMTTMAVTVPMVAAGAAAVKAGMDWESAFTGVRKTVDGSATQISRLEQELRELSENVPSSHTEIAAIAEAAGQLGIHVDNVAQFTEVMVKLGDTTNIVGQEGAINLARFMNVMQTAPDRVGELGATIVHLGNNTATTEAEILELGTRISGAGKIAGLTEADVFALAAAITSVGVKAEAGGTATSKMLLKMHDAVQMGGDDLQTLADVAGMTASQFKTLFEEDAARAFAAFIQGIGRVADSGQAVTPIFESLSLADERLMRAMRDTANAGDLLTDSLDWANDAAAEGTALNEEAAKRYETFASKVKILRNQFYDLGIDLSEILIPVLSSIMDFISPIVAGFASLPRPVQAVAVGLAALAATAGPMIWIAGTLVRNIQAITGAMKILAATSMATPLGALAVALGVAAGAFLYFKGKASEAKEEVKEIDQAVAGLARTLASSTDPLAVMADQIRVLVSENKSVRDAMDAAGITVEDWAQALLDGESASSAVQLALLQTQGELNRTGGAQGALNELLGDFRSEMLSSIGIAEDMIDTEGDHGDALADTTEDLELKTEAEEKAKAAEEAYRARVEATVEVLERQKEALEATVEALRARSEAYMAAADSSFALTDAEDRHAEAVIDLVEIIGDEESTLRDVKQGMDAVAETARDVASAHATLAEETAIAEGKSLSAAEKLDIFNNSLLAQASALEGPHRAALLDYIGRVNGIPEQAITMIETLIEQGKLDEAEAMLAGLSVPRYAEVQADVDQASLDRTERSIDQATRSRTVGVTLVVNNPGALNGTAGFGIHNQFLDSGGQGYAGDIVAEHGPELVDGVLVTRPTMLSRAAKVTGRIETADMFAPGGATAGPATPVRGRSAQHGRWAYGIGSMMRSAQPAQRTRSDGAVVNIDIQATPGTDRAALGQEIVSLINAAYRGGGPRIASGPGSRTAVVN